MALRLFNGRKLAEMAASRLLNKAAPSAAAVGLRRGSDLAGRDGGGDEPAKARRGRYCIVIFGI